MNEKIDVPGNYFPMPKSVFNVGLVAEEIAVYAYLMCCEDRKTFQCHPSYQTIGRATGMSKNTVKRYVESLENKGLIFTEKTRVKTKKGVVRNGTLLYTLKPLEPIEEAYLEEQIRKQGARIRAQEALAKYDAKHGRKK